MSSQKLGCMLPGQHSWKIQVINSRLHLLTTRMLELKDKARGNILTSLDRDEAILIKYEMRDLRLQKYNLLW